MDTAACLETEGMKSDSKYTTCPYNNSHRILKARVQYHLVKCKRNVKIEKPDEEKSICPFDATHHVCKEEFEEHVKNCPNRKIIDSEKYAIETETAPEEEPAAPPTYNFPELPPCEENWDDPSEPAYTYDPTPHLENQPILRTMHGATKSERKAFRQVERLKMLQFISGQPMDTATASSAAGVAMDGNKIVARGRGQSRLPLGKGINSTANGTSVNLDAIIGDRVGHILPCPVELGPLRQPRGTSVALAMARSAEAATPKEEKPEILPSGGAIRKVPQTPRISEDKPLNNVSNNHVNSDKGGWNKVVSKGKNASSNVQKKEDKVDWWGVGEPQKKPSALLEEYKEQTLTTRLAANLGVLGIGEAERTDDERASDFTYKDEEWQTQLKRGRRNVLPARRGRTRP